MHGTRQYIFSGGNLNSWLSYSTCVPLIPMQFKLMTDRGASTRLRNGPEMFFAQSMRRLLNVIQNSWKPGWSSNSTVWKQCPWRGPSDRSWSTFYYGGVHSILWSLPSHSWRSTASFSRKPHWDAWTVYVYRTVIVVSIVFNVYNIVQIAM